MDKELVAVFLFVVFVLGGVVLLATQTHRGINFHQGQVSCNDDGCTIGNDFFPYN